MSSRWMNISFLYNPDNTWSMSLWNVASTFFNLNGIRLNWCLCEVEKAIFYASDSCIGIWWNSDSRSNMLKYFTLSSWSNISIILERGYAFPIVFFSFNGRKSIILHLLLSCESSFLKRSIWMSYMLSLRAWLRRLSLNISLVY